MNHPKSRKNKKKNGDMFGESKKKQLILGVVKTINSIINPKTAPIWTLFGFLQSYAP